MLYILPLIFSTSVSPRRGKLSKNTHAKVFPVRSERWPNSIMGDWLSPQKGPIFPSCNTPVSCSIRFIHCYPTLWWWARAVCDYKVWCSKKSFLTTSLSHILYIVKCCPPSSGITDERTQKHNKWSLFVFQTQKKKWESWKKAPIVHSGVLLHIWLPFEGGIGLRTVRQPLWSVNTYPHMYVNKYKSMGFLSDQEQLTCTLSDGYTSVSHR